jgi:hypothetical protein
MGVLDSGTVIRLDDAGRSLDYYNFSLSHPWRKTVPTRSCFPVFHSSTWRGGNGPIFASDLFNNLQFLTSHGGQIELQLHLFLSGDSLEGTTMTTPPVGVERRIGQRFSFNLPVSLRDVSTGLEGVGFTQDVSSRGAFFFTDMPIHPGAEIELTLKMPSEITLGESMRVRCAGRVLRVLKPEEAGNSELPAETKIGVAVCLSGYDYLSESEDSSADFRRISALHGSAETDRPTVVVTASPREPAT